MARDSNTGLQEKKEEEVQSKHRKAVDSVPQVPARRGFNTRPRYLARCDSLRREMSVPSSSITPESSGYTPAIMFRELVDKIIVESNDHLRFRLINGLELTEPIERTVR